MLRKEEELNKLIMIANIKRKSVARKILYAVILLFSGCILHLMIFLMTEKNSRIIQRSFTIGNSDACKNGPSLSEKYHSELSYYSLKLGVISKRPSDSYLYRALLVSKCKQEDQYYLEDTQKVIRGIEFALSEGEDINSHMPNGLTALHLAAEINNIELVRFLISKGANKNIRNTIPLGSFLSEENTSLEYLEYLETNVGLEFDSELKNLLK